jgi:hypothetical protein
MRYSKGICWIGDCRIPFVDNNEIPKKSNDGFKNWASYYQREWEGSKDLIPNQQGRFTPNLLVCDDMLNDGIKPNKGHRSKSKVTGYGEFGGGKSEYHGIGEYMEVDSKSRYYDLDKWFDKIIDEIQ